MKKIILTLTLLLSSFAAVATYAQQNIKLEGKYLSQSGELIFRFKSDSLYIDIAQSQRNISKFKLVKTKETMHSLTFNAYESFPKHNFITYREVLIRVSKLKEEEFLLEYFGQDKDRDYSSNERYHIFLLEE